MAFCGVKNVTPIQVFAIKRTLRRLKANKLSFFRQKTEMEKTKSLENK
jgi:hypothetical protein